MLDPNVRVAAARVHRDPDATVSRVASTVAEITFAGEGSTIRRHAPVLLIPHALDRALCTRLIELWASSDTAETGVEATAAGERGEATDRSRKRRRDHTVTDPELLRTLSSHIGRGVMPELRKAFAYEAKRFEGFKIGCYRAEDQGFYPTPRQHQPDHGAPQVRIEPEPQRRLRRRRPAVPRVRARRYRPAAGEALVFSAHLHEVVPVSRGRRFVLLSFLFGDLPAAA